MANVYLPLGWPIIGENFESVIYQGGMARLYTGLDDPRSGNQTFERKLLGDVAKLRGVAGKWAKSAWKLTYGTKYTQVLHQMARGDVNGHWSDSWNAYNGLSQAQKAFWTFNAPYQATYNDPGQVWFALYGMLWRWEEEHEGHLFYQPEVDQTNYLTNFVDCHSWWWSPLESWGWRVADDTWQWQDDRKISLAGLDRHWNFAANWLQGWDPQCVEGTFMESQSSNGDAYISAYTRSFRLAYTRAPDLGSFKVLHDGDEVGEVNANGEQVYRAAFHRDEETTGLHSYRIRVNPGANEHIRLDAASLSIWYDHRDVDAEIGGWETQVIGGISFNHYRSSTGSGTRFVEFNIVGAWLLIHFRKGPQYGSMMVYIDGEPVTSIEQYDLTESYPQPVLVGRYRYGLHHVKLQASGNGQINYVAFAPWRSKTKAKRWAWLE